MVTIKISFSQFLIFCGSTLPWPALSAAAISLKACSDHWLYGLDRQWWMWWMLQDYIQSQRKDAVTRDDSLDACDGHIKWWRDDASIASLTCIPSIVSITSHLKVENIKLLGQRCMTLCRDIQLGGWAKTRLTRWTKYDPNLVMRHDTGVSSDSIVFIAFGLNTPWGLLLCVGQSGRCLWSFCVFDKMPPKAMWNVLRKS